ncbi:MAG TPA: type II toxin-antitoxin system RelE/ParE family toxin [Candidatus Saccharimonadales bacterium]|nr:type II toxin-antitoxin system RelE/ParE family toxin [Candidatus Saccharimonadales bacterium]
MSQYRIVFAGSSKKDLDKLDQTTRKRIAKKLQFYIDQEDPLAYSRQLVHSSIGSYRFRVGHYRIVFDIDGSTLQVISIKHRKDVYRG